MELVLDLLRMSAIRLILARDFIRTQSKANRVLGFKKKKKKKLLKIEKRKWDFMPFHFLFTCRAMGQLD